MLVNKKEIFIATSKPSTNSLIIVNQACVKPIYIEIQILQ